MRTPCCEKMGLKKGPWTPEEDHILISFIQQYGHGNWRALPKQAGLLRCGKSCRLRWINYLRPDIKRGSFSKDEEETITKLHQLLGNRWSAIAAKLPGRTDNEIKNFWHTHLKKKLQRSSCSAATNTTPIMNSDTIYKHYSNGLLLSKYANIPMNSTTVQTMTQNISPDHHAMVVAPAVIQSLAISHADQHSAASSTAKMQPTKDHATWSASDVITRSLTDGKLSAIKSLSAMARYPTDDQSHLAHTMKENDNDIGGKKINEDIDFWYNLFVKSGEPSRPS